MTDDVDALLNRMRSCYGSGSPACDGNTPAAASAVAEQLRAQRDTVTGTTSLGTTSYSTTNTDQVTAIDSLAARDTTFGSVVADSARDTQAGRAAIDTTTDQYRTGKTAIAPAAGSPAGTLALLKLKHNKLTQGHSVVDDDSRRAAARAAVVRKLAADYIRRAKQSTPRPLRRLPITGISPATAGSISAVSPMSLLASPPAAAQVPRAQQVSHRNRSDAGFGDFDAAPSPAAAQAGRCVVDAARGAIGLPYVWGGGNLTHPTNGGYDCSGLTRMSVYKATGGHLVLPRTTYDQIHIGTRISPHAIQPGDLVFSHFSSNGPEHVQIYAGHGQVIEAQQTGVPVKYSPYRPENVVVKRVVE